MLSKGLFAITASLTGLLALCTEASRLTPPTLPLVVRGPYLNTHLAQAREVPWTQWPIFWTGQEIGFGILAAVPSSNKVYPLLGRPHDSLDLDRKRDKYGYNISFPTYIGAQYDVSTTNLTYHLPPSSDSSSGEPLEIVVSFISPITPESTFAQALPASYIEITSSGAFDVDIYIDVNGLWVTQDRGAEIVWDYQEIVSEDSPTLKTWQVKRKNELLLSEIGDRAEWGKLYFTGPADVNHQAGTSAVLRQNFARNRSLTNEVDKQYRRVMDEEPVFAFHKSFSAASYTQKVVFTLAHVRDPVAQFAAERGLTLMRPLWASYFSTDHAMLLHHYLDFNHVKTLAEKFSDRVARDAEKAGGEDYYDILALSARQTIGATDFTGTPSAPLIFIKEISSDGNAQTIDIIFPAFPFFMYANPRWVVYLLEPLLEHMNSGQYPNKYAMHDLGFHYPNLTGHPLGLDEYMPVEESGNMLIMGLALVQSLLHGSSKSSQTTPVSLSTTKTEDFNGIFPLRFSPETHQFSRLDEDWYHEVRSEHEAKAWVRRTYTLWKQWTEYLVDYSLEPENQLSTDDFAGWLKLHSNLALKGIVGINAMAGLSELLGEKADYKYYKNISTTYVKKWQEFALSRDGSHVKIAYNWYGSWTTLYSLFADSLLCFHTGSSKSLDWTTLSRAGQSPMGNDPSDKSPSKGDDNFIPHSIYANQSSYYLLNLQKYGLPLDQRHLYTKSDWEIQVAAVGSPTLRKEILTRMARWVNETHTAVPLSDLYVTEYEGDHAPNTRFTTRPVVGSHFSILLIQEVCGGEAAAGLADWDVEKERTNLASLYAHERLDMEWDWTAKDSKVGTMYW